MNSNDFKTVEKQSIHAIKYKISHKNLVVSLQQIHWIGHDCRYPVEDERGR